MKYNQDFAGIQIDDEIINRTNSDAIALAHDTILDDASIELWTGAGGTGTQLTEGVDFTLNDLDSDLTTEAGADIYLTLAIINGTYHSTDIYVSYKTVGDFNDAADVNNIEKWIIEKSKRIGEVFSLIERKEPAEYTGDIDSYFPALCITDLVTHIDISETNWPDLVPYLRGKKVIFKDGMAGEISSPGVTNWSISSNVATLTFTNDADHIALLAALLEDKVSHGGYTNWRSVTLDSAIGSITAGTYAITNVNASSRNISFAFTAANGSGAVTASVDFYAHRIPGSATTARVFSARGLTIHGANDGNGYFVAGGLRRRGYMQGHEHRIYGSSGTAGADVVLPILNFNRLQDADFNTGIVPGNSMVEQGTNGTPRTGKETHSPALSVHLYIHGGRYVA